MQVAASSGAPTVSVGLPVYNGSDYVAQAIESILAQTYGDFELLIQDNASTDATGEICRGYADQDARVRYELNPENIGAVPNYNLVFQRARGRYFKWAAHDDLCAPDFLRLCVAALERRPEVVLAAGQAALIDDDGSPLRYDQRRKCYVTRHGAPVGVIDPPDRAQGPGPVGRFWDILVRTMRTFELFGLIRADVLRRTGLLGNYYGSDKVLLAHLALLGPFVLLPEVLFYRRCHPAQSSVLSVAHKGTWTGSGRRQGWLSLRVRKVIPGYFAAVHAAPLRLDQKLACDAAIVWRFVAPQTWIKQFRPGRYTET